MEVCGFEIGLERPLFVITGPCVIESERLALESAAELKEITAELEMPFVYKSSFDKALSVAGGGSVPTFSGLLLTLPTMAIFTS